MFALLSIISVIILVVGIFFTENINEIKKTKLDFVSLLLSVVGFGGLLYAFSEIGSTGNLNLTISIIGLIGIAAIAGFVYRQNHLDEPMINMSIFKNHNFNLTTLLSTLSNIAMVGIELVMPLYLQNSRMVSALVAGLVMMPGAILMGIFNPISGGLYDKLGVRKVSIIGFAFILIGSIPMVVFNASSSLAIIIVSYALRMVGVALVMMNTFTDGINSLPTQYETDGNAASSTIRQVGGSLGTAISMTVVTLGVNLSSSHASTAGAQITGYQFGFWLMLGIALVGFLLSFRLPKK